MVQHAVSVQCACRLLRVARTGYYVRRVAPAVRDQAVITALQAIVTQHGRWGFWKCYDRLRSLGHAWNHKRVYRVYTALGLQHRRRTKRRVPTRMRQPLAVVPQMKHTWALDFMHDTLYNGRRFRTLNVLDEGVREVLGIEIDTSLPAARVVRTLEQIASWRGYPQAIRCDNGPEYLAATFTDWCAAHAITLRYIQPGKPNQNAFIERFNRTYREEVLSAYLFDALDEVRALTHDWLYRYNEDRPHEALGGMPPTVYRRALETQPST